MADVAEATDKQSRNRNPAYPALSLSAAMARAMVLYEHETRKPMMPETAAKHWEFSVKSSSALQAVSALKQFGLLDEIRDGDARKLKLSELALKIIMDKRPDSVERDQAIRAAALSPRIYKELWKKADSEGILPSDTELEHFLLLVHKPPFYEDAVKGLIKDFRSTIKLAKLSKSDIIECVGQEGKEPTANELFQSFQSGKSKSGAVKEDVYNLEEGQVVLRWPTNLTADSYHDLVDRIGAALKTIGRPLGLKVKDIDVVESVQQATNQP